jgi:hypothetical protein
MLRQRSISIIASIVIALAAIPATVRATDIEDGTTVRIRSSWIDAGWHTGRIKRDGRNCWTVQLDRPTDHGYSHVSLTVVDALQLGRTGAWTAINARQTLATTPQHCFAEGSD